MTEPLCKACDRPMSFVGGSYCPHEDGYAFDPDGPDGARWVDPSAPEAGVKRDG